MDVLAHEGEERRDDPGRHREDGVQRVDGVPLTCPEPVAAAADVPVRQPVQVLPYGATGGEEVVGVHAGRDRGDQVVGLGQDVPVEHVGRVGADRPVDVRGVGVEREERPRVPQRQQHLADRVADARLGDHEVAAPQHGRRQQVPAHRVGPVGVEDGEGVRVVAQALRHLLAVVAEEDAVADAGPEGGPVEQRGGQDVQRVEPATGLPDVLDDEVARVVVLEPVLVLERVVHLRERHRPGLEPAVEHLGHAAHHRLTGGVVRVGPHERVDHGPVEIRRAHAEVPLQLVQAAVDVDARVAGVVALPDGDGRTPEPVAADRPVAGVGQPLAEAAVADVVGHPGDLLVQLDHAVPERAHLDEPRGDRPVHEWLGAAPAVRVRVVVGLVADHVAGVLERPDDERVGVEDVHARPRGDLGRVPALRVHRGDRLDAVGVADGLVLLAVARATCGRHPCRRPWTRSRRPAPGRRRARSRRVGRRRTGTAAGSAARPARIPSRSPTRVAPASSRSYASRRASARMYRWPSSSMTA